MDELLNVQLCKELRGVINETDIFIKDQEENKKFNLICAIMDRFDSAVKYINTHLKKPQTETDLIVFMTFCCTIKDGINSIFKVLKLQEEKDNEIFKEIYIREEIGAVENFTDDKFFKYFRSLVFAHPFLTTTSIPNSIAKEEIQYSPYVLIDLYGLRKENDSIGVRVYSNKRDSFSITFSFDILKKYIKWKYEMLVEVINEFRNIIQSKEETWKKHKISRSQDPIETLNDVKNILQERYIETYGIDDLITYLECESTKEDNNESVKLFKNDIIKIIPQMCDAVDNYENDKLYDIIGHIIGVRPDGHPMMHYQLEKIFCYLNEYDYLSSGDVEWGLKQAEAFSKEFAKKWVIIEPYNMSFNETKMLTNVACYLEYQEQMSKEPEPFDTK